MNIVTKVVTNEEFLDRVYKQVGDEYKVLTPYTKSTEKVIFKHTKCGKTFGMTPNHFLYDHRRCNYCNNGNAKSNDEFKNKFYQIVGNEYSLLSTYHRTHEKVRVRHNVCGNIYLVTPSAFLAGERCPKCYGNLRKTINEFKQEVYKKTSGEYVCVSNEYKNNRTKVKMYHKVCDHYYMVTPHDFIEGNRCPYCKQSKGEMYLCSLLDSLCVDYEYQKVFDWCKRDNGSPLPFDFYLPDYQLCIEYDGIQHFKAVKYFGGMDKLISQKNRDSFKNDCCLKNHISLLRIPYNLSKDNIKEKLPSYLNKCNARNQEPKLLIMI